VCVCLCVVCVCMYVFLRLCANVYANYGRNSVFRVVLK
jgi:NO-binding membrane sensor protein with MHYT domain